MFLFPMIFLIVGTTIFCIESKLPNNGPYIKYDAVFQKEPLMCPDGISTDANSLYLAGLCSNSRKPKLVQYSLTTGAIEGATTMMEAGSINLPFATKAWSTEPALFFTASTSSDRSANENVCLKVYDAETKKVITQKKLAGYTRFSSNNKGHVALTNLQELCIYDCGRKNIVHKENNTFLRNNSQYFSIWSLDGKRYYSVNRDTVPSVFHLDKGRLFKDLPYISDTSIIKESDDGSLLSMGNSEGLFFFDLRSPKIAFKILGSNYLEIQFNGNHGILAENLTQNFPRISTFDDGTIVSYFDIRASTWKHLLQRHGVLDPRLIGSQKFLARHWTDRGFVVCSISTGKSKEFKIGGKGSSKFTVLGDQKLLVLYNNEWIYAKLLK